MQTFTWKRIATATAALSLAACANLGMHDKSWTTLYDKDSNLNGYTVVGDANWRIQHGLLQADLIQKVGPSYLVTKQSLPIKKSMPNFGSTHRPTAASSSAARIRKNRRRQLLRNQHLGHPS